MESFLFFVFLISEDRKCLVEKCVCGWSRLGRYKRSLRSSATNFVL